LTASSPSCGWTGAPQPLINQKRCFWNWELPPDPGSIFGSLFARCIRDEYVKDDPKVLAAGVIFLLLGAFCSVATTYFLSTAGILL
jgi:hypothetical protein